MNMDNIGGVMNKEKLKLIVMWILAFSMGVLIHQISKFVMGG